jgi:hypothetical protein
MRWNLRLAGKTNLPAHDGFPPKGAGVKRKSDGLVGEVYSIDPEKDLLTVRWSARTGHNTLVCTLEQFVRDWELSGKANPGLKSSARRTPTLVIGALAVAACIYGCSSLLSGPTEFKFPKEVLSQQSSQANGSTQLDVTLKLQGWDAGETDLYHAIINMQEVMKHESHGGREQIIIFHLVGATGGARDDYGNPQPSRIIAAFNLRYSMEDINQIDWDHVSEFRILNLGQVSGITLAGAAVAEEYCKKDKEYSNVFCSNFSE